MTQVISLLHSTYILHPVAGGGGPAVDLVLMADFDGADAATAFTDQSTHGQTMTFVNQAQLDTAQQKFGTASALFDGTTDSITVPMTAGLLFDLLNGDCTIEFFYRANTSAGGDALIGVESSSEFQWQILQSNNNLFMQWSTNGTGWSFLDSGHNITDAVWHHIAMVRNGNDLDIYMDGVKGTATQDMTAITVHTPASGTVLTIGSSTDGWIDDLRIVKGLAVYTANFTAPTKPHTFAKTEILAGFDGADAATAFTEESKNLATATFSGNAQLDTAQKKFGTASLLCDGTADFVTFPDTAGLVIGSQDFTIEGWMRFNTLPSASGEAGMGLAAHWASTGNQRSWFFGISTSDELNFIYSTDGVATTEAIASTDAAVLAVDTWYHVAVEREGGTIRMWLDGTALTLDDATIAGTLHNSTDTLRIGALNTSASFRRYMDGWIDDVSIIFGVAKYGAGGFTPEEVPRY